jgi:minor extracellular serine protease Vpr
MKRLVLLLAVPALLVAAFAPAASAAEPSRQIQRADLAKIDPSFRPFLADANRQVTVVLELSDDPALAVPDLSDTQRRSHAKALRTEQGKLDAKIKGTGGRILDRYQYAYNGIKVRVRGNGIAALADLPGVVAVRRLQTYKPDNVIAVPYVGAPSAWSNGGATGAGQTIAVIDTGIDYTHANFGGPGTPEAYAANDPTLIEPGSFPTAKVIAGYDFAGNNYDADGKLGSTTPAPDDDPLDCGDHGTHVAGTAAGDGVLADHSTYGGPYDASTYDDPNAFVVGPGVAPDAKLVALKVFGCEGTTNLVVDALEWVAQYNVTHADDIDVVNMSLGAPFGSNTDPDAVATNNLVDTGVVVVASAGNESSVPYVTGAPAASTKAISVAALDAYPTIPLASVQLPSGDVPGNNQNAYPALPVSGNLHVVPDAGGAGESGISWGCDASDFSGFPSGTIAVVKRGSCPFVDKGANAYAAGAIGIIDINRNDTNPGDLPTFIGYNPELFQIPMVGVDRTAIDAIVAADGQPATIAAAGTEPNPTYQEIADFSSSGPRYGDSWLKPDVSAPGVNLISSLNGSGWNGTTYSGTSMAAPMTSGTAALVREAHPRWSPLKVKAAIVNTADASSAAISDYDPLRAGSGVVQADAAVETQVVATTSDRTASLSFGYEPTGGAFSETKWITISNSSRHEVWYTLSASTSLVKISPSKVKVRAHHSARVKVRASLSRSDVAALPTVDQFVSGDFGGLYSLSGVVVASPKTANGPYFDLRVPYLLVPRGLSDVEASLDHSSKVSGGVATGALRLSNRGVHDGFADVYALGLTDRRGDGTHGTDVRAVGVQALPGEVFGADPSDRGIQFAVNSWDRFSTDSPNEIDIAVDTTGDGVTDYYVVGIDEGLIFAGAYDGVFVSLIFDAQTFALIDGWLADAPTNGSTVILPALASDIGLSDSAGAFTYSVAAYDGFTGGADVTVESRPFDVFVPSQSTGDFLAVASHAHQSVPVWADWSAIHDGSVGGWMIVSLDDRNGASQADIVKARFGVPWGRHRP